MNHNNPPSSKSKFIGVQKFLKQQVQNVSRRKVLFIKRRLFLKIYIDKWQKKKNALFQKFA